MDNQAGLYGKVHQSVVSVVYYFPASIKPVAKQTASASE
jgi:hypothetical protein